MNELRIKNTKPVQHDFLGNGAVYHGYAGMPDDEGRNYSENLCILEASRAADMKLNIARTFYTWWAWDIEKHVWDWDNEVMQCFYRWLQRMKDANITVALNAGWLSPSDILGNSWTGKSPFTVPNDWEASIKKYADWVSETVHQLIELRGFNNIKILVMFTESQGRGKTSPIKPYECWRDAVEAAHLALVRDGRRHLVKFMGPNEASIPGDNMIGMPGEMLKWAVDNVKEDVIDIFSCHVYPFAKPMARKYVKTGKAAVSMTLAGGRFCRTVKLKPNTNYKVYADILFESRCDEESKGAIHFGVFKNEGSNDIHAIGRSGPADSIAQDSYISLNPQEMSTEYRTYTTGFNSSDTVDALVGVFNDVTTLGAVYIDRIILTEEGKEENLIPNGDFINGADGWKLLYATASVDLYDDWYNWAKLCMQYVPKNKQYFYDEFNASYDHDFSRSTHGAELVNAIVAFMNAGVQSSLVWTLFDQQWPNNHTYNHDCFVDGDHRCGVMPVLTRTLIPHLSYYAFSLVSRYIRGGGTKVYEGFGKDCLHTTMAISEGGEITIVVVNNKEEPETFNITFDEPISAELNRHKFNPSECIPDEKAEIIPTDKVFIVNDSLNDTISAYGVSVYTTYID